MRVAKRLDPDLIDQFRKHVEQVRDARINDSDLGMAANRMIGPSYEKVYRDSIRLIQDAVKFGERLQEDLVTASTNWRRAEEANVVRYV